MRASCVSYRSQFRAAMSGRGRQPSKREVPVKIIPGDSLAAKREVVIKIIPSGRWAAKREVPVEIIPRRHPANSEQTINLLDSESTCFLHSQRQLLSSSLKCSEN